MSLRRSKPLLIALLGLLVCPSVFAHGDSYSTLRVVVKADVLEVSLSLNFRDLSMGAKAGQPCYDNRFNAIRRLSGSGTRYNAIRFGEFISCC